MKKFNTLTAGVAFAAILSLSTTAHAQMADPSGQSNYTAHPAQTYTPSHGAETYQAPALPVAAQPLPSLEEWVLARGTSDEINARHSPPGAPRYLVREDDVTPINRQEWHQRGWDDASFDRLKYQSASLCTRTLTYAAHAADLTQRYATVQPRLADLAMRYDKMRGKIKRAGVLRTLFNIAAPVVGYFTGGLGYAGVVAASSGAGEAQGHVSTKQQLLANDAGQLNNELTSMNTEGQVMWLETYQDYLATFTDYCTTPSVVSALNLK